VTRVPTIPSPGRDLLVDTNLLLLGVVGNFDHRLVGRQRLERFTLRDLELLNRFMSLAKRLITTPNILTETGNFAAQLIDQRRHNQLFQSFGLLIKDLDERHERSAVVCEQPAFLRLGLTDAVIAQIARDGMLVLTVDFPLWGYLKKNGVEALNFNHFRAL
jgi:hypothetical protein